MSLKGVAPIERTTTMTSATSDRYITIATRIGFSILSAIVVGRQTAGADPVRYEPYRLEFPFAASQDPASVPGIFGTGRVLVGSDAILIDNLSMFGLAHVFTDAVTIETTLRFPVLNAKHDHSITRWTLGTRTEGYHLDLLGLIIDRRLVDGNVAWKLQLVRERTNVQAEILPGNLGTLESAIIAEVDGLPEDIANTSTHAWTLEAKSGRLTVHCDGQQVMQGYVDLPGNSVKRIGIAQKGPALMIHKLVISGMTMQSFSREHLATMRRIEEVNSEIMHLATRGDYRRAWTLAKENQRRLASVYGDGTIWMALGMYYPSYILAMSGKHDEHVEVIRRQQSAVVALLGEDHPLVALVQWYLASACANAGQDEQGLEALRDAHRILWPVTHEQSFPLRNGLTEQLLGTLRHHQTRAFKERDFAKCLALQQEAADVAKRCLGESHPQTLDEVDMADYLQRLTEQSDDELPQWVAMEQLRLDAEAKALGGRSERRQAIPLLQSLIQQQRELVGTSHPVTLHSIRLLARQYYEVGDADQQKQSLRMLQALLREYEKKQGKQHRYYDTLFGIAVQYYEAYDRKDEAMALIRQVCDYYDSVRTLSSANRYYYGRSVGVLGAQQSFHQQWDVGECNLLRAVDELWSITDPYFASQRHKALRELASLYQDYRHVMDEPQLMKAGRLAGVAPADLADPDHLLLPVSAGAMAMILGDPKNATMMLTLAEDLVRHRPWDQRHPLAAWLAHRQAHLEWQQGRHEAAATLLLKALDSHAAFQRTAFRRATRMEQAGLANRYFRVAIDDLLSLPADAAPTTDITYRHVLGWKGAPFERQRALGNAWSIPDLKKRAQRLNELASAFATSYAEPMAETDPLRERVATLLEDRDRLESELHSIQGDTVESHGLESLIQLQCTLPKDVAVIDYVAYAHRDEPWHQPLSGSDVEVRLAAFLIQRHQPVLRFDLGPIEEIHAAIGAWIDELGDEFEHYWNDQEGSSDPSEPSGSESAGRRVHALIWAPFMDHVHGAKIVAYSPDPVLTLVPLHALPGDLPGTVLLDSHALGVIPCTKWLDDVMFRNPSTKPAKTSLLVAGGITYDAPPDPSLVTEMSGAALELFEPLPRSDEFAKHLAADFRQWVPDGTVEVLVGANATERKLRESIVGKTYVHLHSHGFWLFPGDDLATPHEVLAELSLPIFARRGQTVTLFPGMQSGLALAGANRLGTARRGHDGVLWAEEIRAMDLHHVELIVAAACETAVGDSHGDEGVAGMQMSLHIAGARSSLASLWFVENEATMHLMRLFYENLWKHGMSKAEALRQAQRHMRRHYDARTQSLQSSPANDPMLPTLLWAPFVLSGDWR